MGKNDTLFKDREPQNHTLSRGTYLYSPYMRVSPLGGHRGHSCQKNHGVLFPLPPHPHPDHDVDVSLPGGKICM